MENNKNITITGKAKTTRLADHKQALVGNSQDIVVLEDTVEQQR